MFRFKREKSRIKELEEKLKQRDNFILKMTKENRKLKSKVKDLEAQCEFLFNNLSKKKRELLDADKHK